MKMVLRLERVSAYATFFLFQILMTLEFIVFKFLHQLPFIRNFTTVKWFDWTVKMVMQKEEYWDTAFKWQMYKLQSKVVMIGTLKTARHGLPAPNPMLHQLDGRKEVRLLSYAKGTRPLVLNFGSSS